MHLGGKLGLETKSHALVNLLSQLIAFLNQLFIFLLLFDKSGAEAGVILKVSRSMLLRIVLVQRLILSRGRMQGELMLNWVASHSTVVVWVHVCCSGMSSFDMSSSIRRVLSQVCALRSSMYVAHTIVRISVVREHWLLDLHQVLKTIFSILVVGLHLAVVNILVGKGVLACQVEMRIHAIVEILLALELVVIIAMDVSNEITVILAVVQGLEVRM